MSCFLTTVQPTYFQGHMMYLEENYGSPCSPSPPGNDGNDPSSTHRHRSLRKASAALSVIFGEEVTDEDVVKYQRMGGEGGGRRRERSPPRYKRIKNIDI